MSSSVSSSSHLGRHFSNATITWEIKNASLCFTYPRKIIYGPMIVLSGPIETRWRLFLDISNEKGKFVLNLEMLPNKFRKSPVKVNWSSYILDENEEGSFSAERSFSFRPNLKLVVHMFRYSSLYEKLCETTYDDLKIKCHMLVQFGFEPSFPKSGVEGIVSLSHDLSTLPKDFLYHDITTVVNNNEFSLHKAMLWNRGEALRTLIGKQISGMYVDFNLSNSKAAEAIFTYLYTGDLSYILRTPSLTICDYIKRLGVSGIQNLYPEDKIKIKSEIVKTEHCYNWMIIDFKNVTDTLIGPEFHKDGMVSRWQFHMKVKNSTDNGQEKTTVYVEAVLAECETTLNVCLEFACMKNDSTIVCSRKIQGRMKIGDKLGLVLLEKSWAEIKEILIGDALLICFTVRIATGEILNVNELNRISPPVSMNCEQSFNALSRIVTLILSSHDFRDFHFEIEDEKFRAHKFLVAARSPMFRELFRRDRRLVSIRISDCKKDIFRVFLSYLYIGIIAETDSTKLMDLYDMGDMYQIFSLKNVCSKILTDLLNNENVLRILAWSYEKEPKLTATAFALAISLADNIEEDPYFFYFTKCRPSLHKVLKEFLPKTDRPTSGSDSDSDLNSDSDSD